MQIYTRKLKRPENVGLCTDCTSLISTITQTGNPTHFCHTRQVMITDLLDYCSEYRQRVESMNNYYATAWLIRRGAEGRAIGFAAPGTLAHKKVMQGEEDM